MDYICEEFGIMFISPTLNKREHDRIASKMRKYDKKIGNYTDRQRDLFYEELEKIGYENNMGVIQLSPKVITMMEGRNE